VEGALGISEDEGARLRRRLVFTPSMVSTDSGYRTGTGTRTYTEALFSSRFGNANILRWSERASTL
jgi:hypothetical protein